MQKIIPCLWFHKNNAVEAANFYKTVFPSTKLGETDYYSQEGEAVSQQKAGSVMTQEFEIEGLKILGLNGGEYFKLNPSISFFLACRSEAEIKDLWQKLSKGGEVRMGLDKYPWADLYGWTADAFGVEWQLMLAPEEPYRIGPSLLFTQERFGKAEEAIDFYISQFQDSKILMKAKNESGKFLDHCSFTLNGQKFSAMDGQGEHAFQFNEAFSFMVLCKDQKEIDHYWKTLAKGGKHSQCGWLSDRFGVSWQIIPDKLSTWMADPAKAKRVMAKVYQMTKMDYEALEKA